MATAVPYTIDIPQADLDHLRSRLANTRWADDFANVDWTYGVERKWLQEMVRYWRDEYDWRRAEAAMNARPNFVVDLDGVPIHFQHVRSTAATTRPFPLILTHGWPWTFCDLRGLIDPLTAAGYDVVVPSLPGFGFSTPLTTPGVNVRRVAQLWVRLMTEVLGYDRFGAYGGDWGAIVTSELGHAHDTHVVGAHMSLPVICGVTRRDITPSKFAADEQWMVARAAEADRLIRSHVIVHTHDPQTLAYALADSPVGTAAWLWERRRAWSDCNGDVTSVFSRDDLCTLASIYWLTGTITTSLRLYFEHFNGGWPRLRASGRSIEVPTGFAIFPKELVFLPRTVAAEHTNLQRWTLMERGGHFGPAEAPAEIAAELIAFFG